MYLILCQKWTKMVKPTFFAFLFGFEVDHLLNFLVKFSRNSSPTYFSLIGWVQPKAFINFSVKTTKINNDN